MCHRDRDHANQGETPVIREPPGIDLDWGLSPIHAFGEKPMGLMRMDSTVTKRILMQLVGRLVSI